VNTLEADIPGDQLRQLLAQMEAEAGAFAQARRDFAHLTEGLKQLLLVRLPDADARIHHADFGQELAIALPLPEIETNFAFLGKFDGVVRQVQEYLAQGPPIGLDDDRILGDLGGELQPFLLGYGFQGGNHLLDHATIPPALA